MAIRRGVIEMRDEYNFSNGHRNPHAARLRSAGGHTIRINCDDHVKILEVCAATGETTSYKEVASANHNQRT